MENFLPGVGSNYDRLDLSLPSSKDYKCEPPVPGYLELLFLFI
jgi:hypothetical protein